MRTAVQLKPITPVPEPRRPTPASTESEITPSLAAVAELTRTANAVIRGAADAGIHIEYLGVEPLRPHAVLYEGDPPWVVCPAARDPLMKAGMPIPARERDTLERIVRAGMNFPYLYFAHEVPKGIRLPPAALGTEPDGGILLADEDLARLVVRPDTPAATRKTARRLDDASRLVARGAAKAVVAAGALVAAPLLLFDGLDPVVLGAITRPADRGAAKPPAAWFLLARWDW